MNMAARKRRKNSGRALSRPGRRSWVVVLLAGLVWALGGCSPLPESIPYPDTVYVPRPMAADPKLSGRELMEMYSTSPNLNPDGLGEFTIAWANSHMTLQVWEVARKRQLKNRVALARSDAEQEKAMREMEAFHRKFLVFSGNLKSYFHPGSKPESYQPNGIYLVDDRGRKFLPQVLGNGRGNTIPTFRTVNQKSLRGPSGENLSTTFRYPYLLFPAEAITEKTRAVTLYFAARQKRMSFTWVFDPQYVPERRSGGAGLPEGFERMWRVR